MGLLFSLFMDSTYDGYYARDARSQHVSLMNRLSFEVGVEIG